MEGLRELGKPVEDRQDRVPVGGWQREDRPLDANSFVLPDGTFLGVASIEGHRDGAGIASGLLGPLAEIGDSGGQRKGT